MHININCKYCENKTNSCLHPVKIWKWYEIGRGCIMLLNKHCIYQEMHSKPNIAPPPQKPRKITRNEILPKSLFRKKKE